MPMDPAFRVFLTVAVAVFLRHLLLVWWERLKERESAKPIPMRFRNGVYVPWGPVQRIQHWIDRLFIGWLVYVVLLLVALAAVKLA
jgi:hypothetical protein